MENRNNILLKAYIFGFVLLAVGLAVVFRLVQIQQTDVSKYKELAERTNFRKMDVQASRGNLYASDDVLLATTILKYDVHMDLKTIKDDLFYDNIQALADSLSKILHKPSSSIKNSLTKAKKNESQYHFIARNLDFDEFSRMKTFPIFEKGQNEGGFIVDRKSVRIKPVNDFGTRTIGFDDERGKVGLEGAFGKELKGTNGRRLEQFISGKYWKPIGYWHQDNIEPEDGYDVYTTLNMRIQDIANTALEKQLKKFQADHGCAVVMEVKTGRILAMANLGKRADGTYRDVYNYAVGEKSEPGSTFKVISLLAALDDGYIDPNSTVDIGRGYWKVGGHTIYDDHGHGTLTIQQVLSQSSNVGTAKIIYKYYHKNPEDFVNKLYNWGINQKVGIEINGEAQPVIPHPDDDKLWGPTALAWMSHGYNVALTPLQTLNFYNALANDGVMVKPTLLEKLEKEGVVIQPFKTTVVNKSIASKKARDLMEQMLIEAVEKGTAESIFTPNLKMAGKTGTAQYEYWKWKNGERKYQASFCGYFPADNPKYSCIVVVNQPKTSIGFYGSQVAAPVFKEIAGKVFLKTPINLNKEDKTEPDFHIKKTLTNTPEFKISDNPKTIPKVVGYYGNDVIPKLENAGLKVQYKGVGKIVKQSLTPGIAFRKGATIYLTLE